MQILILLDIVESLWRLYMYMYMFRLTERIWKNTEVIHVETYQKKNKYNNATQCRKAINYRM